MDFLILLIAGFIVAVVGTLVGAGGGFLLVPFLAYYDRSLTPAEVTFISLCVVLANAASATISYARMKRIDWRSGFIFAAATFIPAILGVFVIQRVPMGLFTKFFGGLLTAVGAYLLFRAFVTRNAPAPVCVESQGKTHRRIVDDCGNVHEYRFSMPLGATVSTGIGFLSSFFGIGGGIIHVPFLTQALRFPPHIATATSQFVLLFTVSTAVVAHLTIAAHSALWFMIVAAAIGAVFGAQVGARISRRTRGAVILIILAAILIATGLRIATR